nr:hypothetical protein [uncultured Flavobacterium sp.]
MNRKRLIFAFYFFTILFLKSSDSLFAQTNFSVSADAGLIAAKERYGSAIIGNAVLEFKKSNIAVSMLYGELANDSENIKAKLYNYALTYGYLVSSDDRRFKTSGNIGPSLLHVKNFEDKDKSVAGLNVGVKLSYRVFGGLHIESGVATTFNKITSNLVQTYCGFSYSFNDSNR